jgi:antimicrobial peptide system SdpA family protein
MLRQQARALALCGAIVVVVVTCLMAISLPPADHLAPETKRAANVVREILPEGWSFFTKSPREAFVVAFDEDGLELGTAPNAQPRWAFGLNRTSRLGGIDVDRVIEKLDRDAWRPCHGAATVSACSADLKPQRVRIKDATQSLCGNVILARKEPVPWAFRGTKAPIEQVVAVEVECP